MMRDLGCACGVLQIYHTTEAQRGVNEWTRQKRHWYKANRKHTSMAILEDQLSVELGVIKSVLRCKNNKKWSFSGQNCRDVFTFTVSEGG